MPKLSVLSEIQRKSMLMWPCVEHDDTPWTPMAKPLSESKVALVTTAGLHVRGDKPFIAEHTKGGDTSYRTIPRSAGAAPSLRRIPRLAVVWSPRSHPRARWAGLRLPPGLCKP